MTPAVCRYLTPGEGDVGEVPVASQTTRQLHQRTETLQMTVQSHCAGLDNDISTTHWPDAIQLPVGHHTLQLEWEAMRTYTHL